LASRDFAASTLVQEADATSRTRATAVYERLHVDLLECRFAPGEKLLLRVLMERYNAGIGTIREALMQLISTGLVQMEPQHGFRATPANREDLIELSRLRVEIETMALRNAIANGTDEWEGEILKCLYRLSKVMRTPTAGRVIEGRLDAALAAEVDQRHSEFHSAIVSTCDMARLLEFRESLFVQSNRYRRLKGAQNRVSKRVDLGHRLLADAVLSRNSDKACRLMAEHVMHTTDLLLADSRLKNILGPAKRSKVRQPRLTLLKSRSK
jgi:GntR family transcriptional regulator, carbon starvation induced regulator